MDIQEFRNRYPQYNDINDMDLTQLLHQKYYSDMPFNDFTQKFTKSFIMPQIDSQTIEPRPSAFDYGATRIYSERLSPEEQAMAEQRALFQQRLAAGEIEPVPPGFWERFYQDIPQMAGGTVGGLAGAKVGALGGAKIPAGHPYLKGAAIVSGAVVGATLGGMGGKGYQQFYRMTQPGAKPMTMGEIYTEQAIAGIEEGASELAGRGIAKVGGKLLAPAKKRLIKSAPRLSRALTRAGQKIGIKTRLTPAQMTEARLVDRLESIAENSLFGGKLYYLKSVTQPLAYEKYVDDVAKQVAKGIHKNLSPDEIGDLVLNAIKGKKQIFKATARAAYSKVDDLTRTGKVSLVPLKDFARKSLKMAATRKGIGSTQAGDTLLKKVLQLDDAVTFRQAHALRSALLDEKSAMSLTKDKAIGLANQFIKLTDDSLAQSAKELSPEALNAWRAANKFYRHGGAIKGKVIPGMVDFDSKIIKTLSKSLADNPEVAARKIFQPGATKQINIFKKFVDKKSWQTLKSAYLESIINESSSVDGVVVGKSFLAKLKRMGEPALKEIFTGSELASIRSIGEMGAILQGRVGGGGGMLVQLTQGGAIVDIATGLATGSPGLKKGTGTILLGPPLLGRLMASETGGKWLSQGLRTPKGTPGAIAIASRLSYHIAEAQYSLMKEQKWREQESKRRLRELGSYF